MSDEDIKKDIVDELFWDNRIDASKIQVTVTDGVVKLSGEVHSLASLLAVEEGDNFVLGVKEVKSLIAVKPAPTAEIPSDGTLKERIQSILAWNTERGFPS